MTADRLASAPLVLPPTLYEPVVRAALREDLGDAGDVTSNAVIDAGAPLRAAVTARRGGRLAGVEVAACAFRTFDRALSIDVRDRDGVEIVAGAAVLIVSGSARGILGAERTALNLISHLSGIATLTSAYVRAVAGHQVTIVDTRKTLPGLRALEKYAVRAGGGRNHRFGLYDAVLIKDNHIAAAGGIAAAIEAVRGSVGHLVRIEIEVDTLSQLQQALEVGADAILLDNMSLDEMRDAARITRGRALLEASGSVSLDNVADVAATGVDLISVGRLTHSAPALDFGLDVLG